VSSEQIRLQVPPKLFGVASRTRVLIAYFLHSNIHKLNTITRSPKSKSSHHKLNALLLDIGVARGCTCTLKGGENIFRPNLQGKVVSAPPDRECTPEAEQEFNFRKLGRFGRCERLFRQFYVCFGSDD